MELKMDPKDAYVFKLIKMFTEQKSKFAQYANASIVTKDNKVSIMAHNPGSNICITFDCETIKDGSVCIPTLAFDSIAPVLNKLEIIKTRDDNVTITADSRVYSLLHTEVNYTPIKTIGNATINSISSSVFHNALIPSSLDSVSKHQKYHIEINDSAIVGGYDYKFIRYQSNDFRVKPKIKLRLEDACLIKRLISLTMAKDKTIKYACTFNPPELFIKIGNSIEANFHGLGTPTDITLMFSKMHKMKLDITTINTKDLLKAIIEIKSIQSNDISDQIRIRFNKDGECSIESDTSTNTSLIVGLNVDKCSFDFDYTLKTKIIMATVKALSLLNEKNIDIGLRVKDKLKLIVMKSGDLEIIMAPIIKPQPIEY